MHAVRLRKTSAPNLYWGDDGRLYELVSGTEVKCCRCGRWAHVIFRWGAEIVCGRHVYVASRTRIRVTTTFALRVYRTEAACPAGRVVRRGDELTVTGPPRRRGRFDRFELPDGGFVLIPRSRWAWA